MARKNAEVWRRSNIDQTKMTIKKELDQVLLAHGEEGRLYYIVEQMQQLEKAEESQDMLRRFILVMSALVHHYRFGGLGKRQIHDLASQGQAILRVVGIKPGHTQVSFLYSELHSVLSDIHHSNSEFLQALWERQLAAQMAIMPPEHTARQNLGMGTCALRLGNASLAVHFLQSALAGSEDGGIVDRIRIQLVKAMRLTGKLEETEQLIRESEKFIVDESCKLELQWQQVSLRASTTKDLSDMMSMTRKGKSHFSSSYIMELYLWAACHPKTQWLDRMPSMERLPGPAKIDPQHHAQLQSIIQSIAEAYDSQVPFAKRLIDVKKILPKISTLHYVDHELLVWNALARWLYRSRHYELAAIAFYEYKSLSQKLSEGRSGDVLNLAEDLFRVDWLQKSAS